MSNEDDRTFIQRELDVAKDMCGAEPSPDEFAMQFSKMDLRGRSMKLDEINRDLVGRQFTVSEASKYHSYQNALHSVHSTLRRLGK